MKTIKRFLIAIVSLAAFNACEKDGALITMSGLQQSDLMATASDVVLTQATNADNVLTVSWTTSTLTVSDPNMSAPNVLVATLQISKSNDFSGTTTETVEPNLSRTFTGYELNTIAKNLGAVPGTATPLYFRIKSSIGANMAPVYSKVVTVNVTAYQIDMSVGFILDSKKADTGFTLYSATSNGEYVGFMGATAWYNYFLKEGDGTIWGNDAVSGTPFVASSASGSWNFWFPGVGGCYYVDVNTSKKQWSALLIPALTVSGDISGDMTFDRPNVKWTIPFTATSTTLTVKLSGTGKQYNVSTGTTDASAIDTPVAFAQSGANLVLASQAGDLTFTVPQAGNYTLEINLSNPKGWTISAVEGSVQPPQVAQQVYLPGIDDGISGSWTFDNFLKLYNEDQLSYAGVVNVNSLWGYTINTEKDNWDEKYAFGTGDANSGTLVHKSSTNIPAPAAGLYLIDASLKGLTYKLTPISKVYYTGLNDDWALTEMTETSTPGTYTSTITISKASQWGFQIFVDDQWTNKFGGSNGSLVYNGANITDDQTLTPGTYTLIVNLAKGTYSIAGDKLYVVGINDVWNFTSMVLPTTAPGIYSGQVTVSANTPWGYYFLLYADNWNIKFGGSENALIYGGDNIVSNWYATMGTYTMTVNLINRTCTVQ